MFSPPRPPTTANNRNTTLGMAAADVKLQEGRLFEKLPGIDPVYDLIMEESLAKNGYVAGYSADEWVKLFICCVAFSMKSHRNCWGSVRGLDDGK